MLTRGYIPPNSEDFVCTEAQGIELETVWKDAYDRRASENEADKAILQRLGKIRDEAKTSVREEDCA
ncbi:hypothetical protein [Erythrobacter donghaensis]|uniref:hypothetical protein n=1 Tax=Erythrobacter donghaensis TaxID=267135 RepID=UPI000A3C3C35|nr:hypothetical protein [Erythrobacter donghaensis]